MKTYSIIGIVLMFLVAGCQHPTEVQLTQDSEEPGLEVTSLAMVDTSVYQTAIDSLPVTPADDVDYAGLLLVNNIKFDGGIRWGVQTVTSSSVVVTDRSRPLEVLGKVFGYYGIRLMPNYSTPDTGTRSCRQFRL
jgi:hypothetical protein